VKLDASKVISEAFIFRLCHILFNKARICYGMENAFLQGSAGIETIGNGLEFLMWQFQASNLSLSVTVIQEVRGRAYSTLLGLSLLRWLGLL
jgi:hypothetical protein